MSRGSHPVYKSGPVGKVKSKGMPKGHTHQVGKHPMNPKPNGSKSHSPYPPARLPKPKQMYTGE